MPYYHCLLSDFLATVEKKIFKVLMFKKKYIKENSVLAVTSSMFGEFI